MTRDTGSEAMGAEWAPRATPPPLGPGTVHVWCAAIDVVPEALDGLERVLPPDEAARADRFATPALRGCWVASQATLRRILAAYTGAPPERLRFGRGERGKPYLLDPSGTGLRFNHSHSGALALYAVALGTEVGVDVEADRAVSDMDALARRFFSPLEAGTLRSLPAAERPKAFLRAWTRKEAFVKATGRGIAQPLSSFAVAFAPGETPRLLWQHGEPDAPARWTIHDLAPAPGYTAALAVAGTGCGVRTFRWAG